MTPAPTSPSREITTESPGGGLPGPSAPASAPASTPAPAPSPEASWQVEWGRSFRTAHALLDHLQLNPADTTAELVDHDPAFPLRVPRAYADLMRKGDWNDPLLRQVLALRTERTEAPGFKADAVGDTAAQDGRGVLRKYRGRALLVVTGECAVHCRYCFRREFPYADQRQGHDDWDAVYARLNEDPEIEEILFSGGDPLALSNARLERHLRGALSVTRLRRVRIHTRVPVVLPARVDDGLLDVVREVAARKPLHIVLHINHAREIGAALVEKARALRAAGAILLNQSVLLRGVNDDVDTLADLSLRLLDAGIMPYYLHQLDRVRGAHHFEVSESAGLAFMEALRARVPGYALPRYVKEVAGEASKTPVLDPTRGGAFKAGNTIPS